MSVSTWPNTPVLTVARLERAQHGSFFAVGGGADHHQHVALGVQQALELVEAGDFEFVVRLVVDGGVQLFAHLGQARRVQVGLAATHVQRIFGGIGAHV
jgi:hypothetical protein